MSSLSEEEELTFLVFSPEFYFHFLPLRLAPPCLPPMLYSCIIISLIFHYSAVAAGGVVRVLLCLTCCQTSGFPQFIFEARREWRAMNANSRQHESSQNIHAKYWGASEHCRQNHGKLALASGLIWQFMVWRAGSICSQWRKTQWELMFAQLKMDFPSDQTPGNSGVA